ncbi:MAG TPA: PQQ-binding-like beta-propeller repeat protein [Ktedonobacteraceae bacterium]
MNEHKEFFLPEQVDEQIDSLTPSTPASIQLISDLQTVYHEENEIVEQVRVRLGKRLAERRLGRGDQNKTEDAQTPGRFLTLEKLEHAQSSERGVRPLKQPRKGRRSYLLNTLAAVLIIALLLSATIIFFRNRPTTSANSKLPLTSPTDTAISAPVSGLYIITSQMVTRMDRLSGHVLWQVPEDNSAQPVILGNVVVVSSTVFPTGTTNNHNQTLKAAIEGLDANTGRLLWRINTQATYLLGAHGIVYASGCSKVNESNCFVIALNATTGHQLWSYNTISEVIWITLQDNVVFGAQFEQYLALNARTGARLWQKTLPLSHFGLAPIITGNPVVSQNVLYLVACANGVMVVEADCYLYAINISNGIEKWSIEMQKNVTFTPVVTNNRVYVGTAENQLLALDTTGRSVWTLNLNTPLAMNRPSSAETDFFAMSGGDSLLMKPLLVANGSLYIQTMANQHPTPTHLLAVDTTNHSTYWSRQLDVSYNIVPAPQTLSATDTQLYVLNGPDSIGVLNPSDGSVLRTYTLQNTSAIAGFVLID